MYECHVTNWESVDHLENAMWISLPMYIYLLLIKQKHFVLCKHHVFRAIVTAGDQLLSWIQTVKPDIWINSLGHMWTGGTKYHIYITIIIQLEQIIYKKSFWPHVLPARWEWRYTVYLNFNTKSKTDGRAVRQTDGWLDGWTDGDREVIPGSACLNERYRIYINLYSFVSSIITVHEYFQTKTKP